MKYISFNNINISQLTNKMKRIQNKLSKAFSSISALIVLLVFIITVHFSCSKDDKGKKVNTECYSGTLDGTTSNYYYNCFEGTYDVEITMLNNSYLTQAKIVLPNSESYSSLGMNLKSDILDLPFIVMSNFYSIYGHSGTLMLNNEANQIKILSGYKEQDSIIIKTKVLNPANLEYLIVIKANKIN